MVSFKLEFFNESFNADVTHNESTDLYTYRIIGYWTNYNVVWMCRTL